MKKMIIFLFAIIPIFGFSQIDLPEISGEVDWEKVIITRNPDDVKGLERVATVNGEAQNLYGKQSTLRTKATEQIKREAAKQGASIVLVTLDNFAINPINNVQMIGTAYKKGETETATKSETKNEDGNKIDLPEISGEVDWEKVIITRNPDDVKGLERVATVNGETQNLYGKQSTLRTKATEQIKREAAKQGASIVLVTLDNFAINPINNVQMEGTAYKKGE